MRLELKILGVAFGLIVCATLAAHAATVSDIAGWSDTRWGMSPDDLLKVHPEMTIGPDRNGFTVGRLPDVMIGDVSFKVNLGFKGIGGQRQSKSTAPEPPRSEWRLNRVDLIGPADACYHITETLTAKYGVPSKQESGYHLWVLPTTTVRQVVFFEDCKIIYHPTDKSDSL